MCGSRDRCSHAVVVMSDISDTDSRAVPQRSDDLQEDLDEGRRAVPHAALDDDNDESDAADEDIVNDLNPASKHVCTSDIDRTSVLTIPGSR